MFDGVTIRKPLSYAKLYTSMSGNGSRKRFFGELCSSRLDSECWRAMAATKELPDLPNDVELLKSYNRKLTSDLKKQENQSERYKRFCSRLAKKLVCLGQMSDNELKTSFNLGLKIEVSNIHWLLNRSPWNATREAMTSVESRIFRANIKSNIKLFIHALPFAECL